MARKTVGYVHLQWTCPNCNTKNPGLAKYCMSCGAPQPDNVEFEKADLAEIQKEGALAEAAKKGADIHCPYCGARNPADAKFCSQCGGDLVEGKKRQAGKVVGAYAPDKADKTPKVCQHCGTSNPPGATTCSKCGASLVTEKKPAPAKVGGEAGGGKKIPTGCIIGLVATVVLIIIIFIVMTILGGSTKESLDASVQSVNWERVVSIEAIGPVTREGWRDEIPVDAEIGTCTKELYEVHSEPVTGAWEICGTPYVVDTGTGAGEVVQDCEYQVFAEYCDYTVQDWTEIDSIILQGSDLNPEWPSPQLGSDQRLGSQSENYTVVFETSEGTYTYTTTDAQEFEQFNVGSGWTLNVNAFNQIVSIESQ